MENFKMDIVEFGDNLNPSTSGEEKKKITTCVLTSPDFYHTIIKGHSFGLLEKSELREIIETLDNAII